MAGFLKCRFSGRLRAKSSKGQPFEKAEFSIDSMCSPTEKIYNLHQSKRNLRYTRSAVY